MLAICAYTGINNAPTIVDDNDSTAATNAIGMSYYCRNNGVATIVLPERGRG